MTFGASRLYIGFALLAERQFIERMRRMAGTAQRREVIRGIGDDCAVLQIPPKEQLLVTTDLSIEDVHFSRKWHPARSTGHRCLARGLSDIAAMGGTPMACFLSLGVPAELPQKWVDAFLRGLLDLAARFKVQLAGGDSSSAEKIAADIMVLGRVPAGIALLRSGARTGDRLYLTGRLGGPAAVLRRLYGGKKIKPSLALRHFYPVPRIGVGLYLRQRKLASAMIDVSDGLSVDLSHLCRESGVSALIDEAAIPIAAGADLDLALHGGEDYELLFTAPQRANLPSKIAGIAVTRIGEIVSQSSPRSLMQIRDPQGRVRPLKPGGWEHFRKF